ncbi:MAG: S8 family serine peptidase [Actinobacteria bacterium]|nr:S8 family serine peptidase [Actinomycetota bacterium]
MRRWAALSLALAMLAFLTLGMAGAFFVFGGGHEGVVIHADFMAPAWNRAAIQDSAPQARVDGGGNGQEVPDGEVPGSRNASSRADAKQDPKLQSSMVQLAAVQSAEGPAAASDFAKESGIRLRDGRVQVVIEAAPGATEAVSIAAEAAGGKVQTVHGDLVQAEVPVESLASLAKSPSVEYVRQPHRPTLATTSEGVADIGAVSWQAAGDTGAGASVAVLDPGFTGYQDRINSGELPANLIAMSFVAGGDINGGGEIHGTACAEIVYDVAPGAQLYLVNFNTDVELANAVDYLIAQGVDVVSASWGFFGDFRGDGQGDIDTIVQNANAAGITWANAAGNSAQTHWSGLFTDADGDNLHEFAVGDEGNDFSYYVNVGDSISLFLTWDRWPLTDQDYDFHLVWTGNASNNYQSVIVAESLNWQGVNHLTAPSEQIGYTVPPGQGGTYYARISKYSAAGDATFQLYSHPFPLQYQVAAGSLGGQPADSPYAMTVGAVPYGGTTIEYFSSRGPTIDGRIKPDIVAPDRVSTVTYGLSGFPGTSAATPHAAGAATLIKAAFPAYTPSQIQARLESLATGLGVPGKDNTYGSGKLNMGPVLDHAPPLVTGVQPSGTVYDSSGAVVVYYMDSYSGIDAASVQVQLDGVAMSGCAATASQVSCPFSDLAAGLHSITGSVSDTSGNTASISGSFTEACGKPLLSLETSSSFWASYEDYLSHELSVTFSFCNSGTNDAFNVAMVGSINTNSAVLASLVPGSVGNIAGGSGSCAPITVKYLVPAGVSRFRATVYATAENSCGLNYAYPSLFLEP